MVEEACAVEHVEFVAEVVVRHPELAVVAEAVVEFVHPVRRPFLRAVAPRAVPFADAVPGSLAPGISKVIPCEPGCASEFGEGLSWNIEMLTLLTPA